VLLISSVNVIAKTGGCPLMYGLCPVCHHSQRSAIDERLRASRALRPLADEFGVPITALRHHRDEHLPGRATGRRSTARARP
jgi:hypothetical protein